jgi:hypothetical protein
MNIRTIGKLTLVALMGSLIWAGCASDSAPQGNGLETTVDLTRIGPDTRPQYRSDLYSPFDSGWVLESVE